MIFPKNLYSIVLKIKTKQWCCFETIVGIKTLASLMSASLFQITRSEFCLFIMMTSLHLRRSESWVCLHYCIVGSAPSCPPTLPRQKYWCSRCCGHWKPVSVEAIHSSCLEPPYSSDLNFSFNSYSSLRIWCCSLVKLWVDPSPP